MDSGNYLTVQEHTLVDSQVVAEAYAHYEGSFKVSLLVVCGLLNLYRNFKFTLIKIDNAIHGLFLDQHSSQ